ncbi:hypothetical protein H2198_002776 [Neophaeococcomyces mojaviensis]|uniref:Uncharacterized protein n=1 Tax=Neophaeococcomyces mojaviensis TaxID=3383035 RepID=A0ACC3AD83_9EURO|nr:hypothetical protein H2198_002776 [Knufia sp. JES_112]
MTSVLRHPLLGAIRGTIVKEKLYRCYSLPYASLPRRFARSQLLKELPNHKTSTTYDAAAVGPSSIQLPDAAHSDAENNQLPTDDIEKQDQNEDCLRLTLTRPLDVEPGRKLPVVVFIHGGAFFLGSGERQWLDPTTFCLYALDNNKPLIFVSVNYRLGLLGFLHSPETPDILPANNALHDQLRAFDWIKQNIAGFGGDPDNITALGQSAGGESLSLHNLSGLKDAMYKRSITLSGTLVTMPAKTPSQYQSTFLSCAEKMDIKVKDRSSNAIAEEMLTISIDKIRAANFVGAPCTSSEVLPYVKPTMQLMRSRPPTQVDWLESQIVSTCTYDGSISYIMTRNNPERKDHAASFIKLTRDLLKNPNELLDIYGINDHDEEDEALRKICLFESDIGFVSATISQAMGMKQTATTKAYLQIFDLGNPFKGPLPQEQYASHTWDIVALLGAYEDRLSEQYVEVIRDWRSKVLDYVTDGTAVCDDFKQEAQNGLLVNKDGVRAVAADEMPGAERRARLWSLAEAEKGEEGLDFLWEGVCRKWLDG